jgi:colanic acid/amylovoran biosynthesis glycosyltransferase
MDGPRTAGTLRIGYYVHTYPRATDTFIQREIAALRARGVDIETFAARRSEASHDVAAEIHREKARTSYLLPAGPLRLVAANLSALLGHPGRFLRALRLALTMARGGWRVGLHQLFYFQEALLLARLVRSRRIVHLHNHFGDVGGTITLLASELTGIGFSITVHGPHLFFDPMRWGLGLKLHRARFIACIGEYCRGQMMALSDTGDWRRLPIVRCGVDAAVYERRAVSERAHQLLYVGRLAPEKGLPVLLRSLAALTAQGHDFQLTILGDGPDRGALEQLARELDFGNRVRFGGYVDQATVLRHLSETDIFVLPSLAEGIPVSLMEAMACGVPVLATAVGGIAELVQDGETGLLVPPSDDAALQSALLRYLTEPTLRQRVARQGRLIVEQHFSLEREIDKLLDLFRNAVRGGENA